MVLAVNDYSKFRFGLRMTKEILEEVNSARVGHKYFNYDTLTLNGGKDMAPLTSTPGIVIENPCKAGNGYWKFEKMACQTED